MFKNRSLSIRRNSYNKKRMMYESIMSRVGHIVKDTLNETLNNDDNDDPFEDEKTKCTFENNVLKVNDGVKEISKEDIKFVAKNFEDIKQIILPNGLKKIGESCFEGCENLEEDLIIPESVSYIGPLAFIGCFKNGIDIVILSDFLAFNDNISGEGSIFASCDHKYNGEFHKALDLSNSHFFININILIDNPWAINKFFYFSDDKQYPHIKLLCEGKQEYEEFFKVIQADKKPYGLYDIYKSLWVLKILQFGSLQKFKAKNNIQ